jgi:hypothetical protein
MSTYDDWKTREPDLSLPFEAGVFDSRPEAEMAAEDWYPDQHVEFSQRGSRTVLWVWETMTFFAVVTGTPGTRMGYIVQNPKETRVPGEKEFGRKVIGEFNSFDEADDALRAKMGAAFTIRDAVLTALERKAQ